MTIDQFRPLTDAVHAVVSPDSTDAAFTVVFSLEDDKYRAQCSNMDPAVALIIIRHLCRRFGLWPEVIATMIIED